MDKGYFISIEGIDGAGKTTQINKILNYFVAKGYEVVITREPGGSQIGTDIRKILLNKDNSKMSSTTELLLYAADRRQHVEELIKPAIADGKIVISDRYCDSTVAYQGYGRGLDMDLIHTLNSIATDNVIPDITFFIDIDTTLSRKRVNMGSDGNLDRLELEDIAFFDRVRSGFLEISQENHDRVKLISGDQKADMVFNDIYKYLEQVFNDR